MELDSRDVSKDEMKISREMVAGCIDHTILKPEATGADIVKLCEEADRYGFASVCVNPVFVSLAAETLKDSGVKVCTVVGFPLGASATAAKVYEAGLAVKQGAAEIDMVLHIGALKEGSVALVEKDIAGVVNEVKSVNPGALVKVILETCLLSDAEKVQACKAAESAGANYVKTSTGFSTGGAVISDVILMKNSVGPNVRVKASGGIRTASDAISCIKAGASRLGTSAGVKIMCELEDREY